MVGGEINDAPALAQAKAYRHELMTNDALDRYMKIISLSIKYP
jgi:hypothetical protein